MRSRGNGEGDQAGSLAGVDRREHRHRAPGKRSLSGEPLLGGAAPDAAPVSQEARGEGAGSRAGDWTMSEGLCSALGLEGGGEPLPGELRGSFERSLGADLGAVRLHTGAVAEQETSHAGARAFTIGNDIAFGAGQLAPDTREGRWLLAHEVAHTVQQQGAAPEAQPKLETTQAGDAAEDEADRAADAMVAGQPATVTAKPRALARFPPMGPVGGGARDGTPEWKKKAGSAKDYVVKHGAAIITGLYSQIVTTPFETGMEAVSWTSGSAAAFAGQFALEFFLQRDDPWQFLVTTLAPQDVEPLIDKGRDALAMPEMAGWYNPGVQIELGNIYKAKLREALRRVVPRYVSVWNQHAITEEAKLGKRPKGAPAPLAPEPAVTEVRASTPIDPHVIRALAQQLKIDFERYRQLHPEERRAHAIKGIDKVTLEIQWRQRAINWVRATPAEATAEDVASELYGSETFTYLITPAAPLFGFQSDAENLGKLKPGYREQLRQIQGNSDYHGSAAPAHGLLGEAPAQVLAGPLGDEAAKNQAKGVKPTSGLTKEGLVERLRVIVGELDWLQQSVKRWGQEALVDAVKQKVDQRSRALDKDGDPAAGAEWDGQSQLQLEVVQTCRNAVQVAAKQEEAFKTFPSARWLIINLVRDYLEAASLSDLGVTARAKLAAAEQRSRAFPADLMEALLDTFRPVIHSARIKKTKSEGTVGGWDDSRYGAGDMAKKEMALRQALARVRDLLMEHPEKAKGELDRLLEEVKTLSTEVTLVSNMDSCDAAWAALDASLSKVGAAVSWVTSKHGNAPIKGDRSAVAKMRDEWKTIYGKWKAAKNPEEKQEAEAELASKAKSSEWTELFEKIREDIEDHATYDKWVTFGVMVGIAIITGGIGAYVEAAAGAAWGATAGFAASTAVEAATFTALSQTLVQKDPTLATFFDDFEKNVLMFGGLKAVGKVWGVSAEAMGLTGGETAATGVLVQFAALNGAALYEADQAKRKATGGVGLTGDEIASLSFDNLAFLIAVSIGQRIAKPFLANLQLEGHIQGELIAARSAGVKVERLARQVEAEKGKDPAKSRQLNQALADALAKQEAALARLGEQVKLYEAGKKSALSKAQYERIKAQMAEHAEQVADFARMQILELLEPAGPNRFEVAGRAAMQRVVDHFGAEAVLVGVDPVTQARTYEIQAKDAAPWRVTERMHARAGETARPPEAGAAVSSMSAEQASFARVREGKAGVIRPESELSNADVADSMNAQLQKIKTGQVEALVERFPEAQREHARQVLARASGFGQMESMNALREALEPHLGSGKKLYVPGSGSLADNVHYLSTKKTFKVHPGQIETTSQVLPGTVVIFDPVVLARIKSDPGFAQSLNQPGVVLIQPRGFTDGINLFNAGSPEIIGARTQRLLDRATRLEAGSGGKLTFDEAITRALDETTRETLEAANVGGTLEVVDPAAHPDLSNAGIAKQLNGDAGVTEAQIEGMLSRVPETFHAMLRELLAQQAEIYSPRRISNDLASQHAHAMAMAASRGIKPEKVYFLIPDSAKSYGMMAMAHREATGTPVDHYLNGSGELAARRLGPDTMVVVLDDVAGSGDSLNTASLAASGGGYKGQVVISPMVSASGATKLFTEPGKGITSNRPNTSYLPGRIMQALMDSPMYKGLSEPQQKQLVRLLDKLGFDQNGLSMAFPYMAPDNNNAMFGDQLAKEFIVNKNRDAAKTYGPWKPDTRVVTP